LRRGEVERKTTQNRATSSLGNLGKTQLAVSYRHFSSLAPSSMHFAS
jgi:hypothetical protein